MSLLADNEIVIRSGVFFLVLLLMLTLEVLLPRKKLKLSRPSRWLTNFSLVIIDSLVARILVPIAAIGMAAVATQREWGLFSYLHWPNWIEIVVAVALLDMLIYWQHVITHHVPLLWAVHKVHHSDTDFDTTTGIRFHPVEIVLSLLYKLVCVVLLGAPVLAVLIFETLLNACALFNHANVALPVKLDRLVRYFIVTPDMHRVHHSSAPSETNSNYGFSLSLWDYIFRTYRAQPAIGHDDMVIGLNDHQSREPASLIWCLLLPFRVRKRRQ